jgi:hypothetical protein
LVIGILIGTYSSIAIAAPILVAYQDWRIEKGKRPMIGGAPRATGVEGKGSKAGNPARSSKAGVSN